MRQKLTVERRNSTTIIVEDFNIPLSIMDETTRERIRKETEDMNNTIKQLDQIEHYPTSTADTLFALYM
jgi:hypothetical protein